MTGEVVGLAAFKAKKIEEETPHATGPAKCLACHHEWVFVQPANLPALDLVCPACGLHRGKRCGLTIPNEPHWFCNCGNDLFLVTATYVWCPNCATEQNFGKENV